MASNKKPTLEENRITESGWTFPEDVIGKHPGPRPEIPDACEALVEFAWECSAPRWVGNRFALLMPDGEWSSGQEDLFVAGGALPKGSWPKRLLLTADGEAIEVRPWAPRPAPGSPTLPTPVSYDATPGGPGNHYKGLGHQARHNGEMFSSPTASTASGADMVQALFPGNSPARPSYADAAVIFAEGRPGIWRMPSAREYKGADPKNATGRQIGLNDQVMADSKGIGRGDGKLFATPQHHDASAGNADRVGRFGTAAGGRNLNDEVMLFPTPTGTERAGTTPETGKGGGLSRHVKDAAGIVPTPRANDAL